MRNRSVTQRGTWGALASLALKYGALLAYAAFTLIPLVWMLSASFKPLSDVLTVPVQWIPTDWRPQNYAEALFDSRFSGFNLARFLLNSTIVAVLTTAGSVFLSLVVGYGFAKFRFRGRDAMMWIVLGSTLLPFSSVLIPLYIVIRGLSMENTLAALVVPFLLTGPNIFLARQFMLSIPSDLLDAARIDGASEWRVFTSVVLPTSGSVAATLGIMTFIFSWTLFVWPLVVIESQANFTMPLGLSLLGLGSTFLVDYHLWMAAASIAVLPPLLLFLALNKIYLRGMEALSGLKG